jgi:predicted GIY-YIG superfamily endonuclease
METISKHDDHIGWDYIDGRKSIEDIAERERCKPIEVVKFCIKNNIRFDVGNFDCIPYRHKNVLEIVWKNSSSLTEAAEIMNCGAGTVSDYLEEYKIREKQARSSTNVESKTLKNIEDNSNYLTKVFGDYIKELSFQHYLYVIEGRLDSGEKAYYVGETSDIERRLREHIRKDISSEKVDIEITNVDIMEADKEKYQRQEKELFKETILEKETTKVYGGM